MEKVIDYQNVVCSTADDLDKEVCAMIRRGWTPVGRASYATGQCRFMQTMVKYAPDDSELTA